MAALYRALAQFPEAREQFFGFQSFSVQVTVIVAARQRPFARMRELMRLTREGGTTTLFRITLGGWLFAYGPDARWFEEGHVFARESVRMQDHETSAELSWRVATAGRDSVASSCETQVAPRHVVHIAPPATALDAV